MREILCKTHAEATRIATEMIAKGAARFVRIAPCRKEGAAYKVEQFAASEWRMAEFGSKDATEEVAREYEVRDWFYNSANKQGRQYA